jgi:16S rRNA (guanine1516-N2)-methyltransferase
LAQVFADASIMGDRLVKELGFEEAGTGSEVAFLLAKHEVALDLRPPGEHGRRGVQAHFPPDRPVPNSRSGGDPRNPLIRAFGKQIDALLDLTAGFGGDAYRLAQAGHRVRAFERHPAIYALLASGWERAIAEGVVPSEVRGRLSFHYGEGGEQIGALNGPNLGVYVDPMYPPPRRRSAKPRRELQVLRSLLGGQTDAASLVERARDKAARVVVKRPRHAEPLVRGASFEIETKLVRFDVYVNPERMEGTASE